MAEPKPLGKPAARFGFFCAGLLVAITAKVPRVCEGHPEPCQRAGGDRDSKAQCQVGAATSEDSLVRGRPGELVADVVERVFEIA